MLQPCLHNLRRCASWHASPRSHRGELQIQEACMTLATIAGVGMTKFGKQAERSIEEIGREALVRAMKDAGIGRDAITEGFCGSSYGGPLIGQGILGGL